jgi:hypothetical protein
VESHGVDGVDVVVVAVALWERAREGFRVRMAKGEGVEVGAREC